MGTQKAVEELPQPESRDPDQLLGTLCVVDDFCKLCRRRVRCGRWGNPKCRGCSIVDRLSFEHHPFYHLLVDHASDIKLQAPVAEWPHMVSRADLTPPPLRPSNALRE